MEIERPAGVVDDAGLIASPAWIGEPDLPALLFCKGLGVFDGAGLGVKVGNVQCSAGNLALESLLVLETDFGLIDRQAQTIQVPALCQVAFDLLENRLALELWGHQEITPALLGMSVVD